MRVIGGTARGTRLARVPPGTRPVSDRAREGLFASLGDAVVGARCVDLFAGTGALGIEALSRGAEHAVLVDSSESAVRTLRANLTRTGLASRGTVVRSDVRRFLARRSDRFDLAFLDPPYAAPNIRDVLELAASRLAPGAILVLTRARRDTSDVVPVHLLRTKLLAYGDTHILICREGT